MTDLVIESPSVAPPPRKPRKVFLLVGIVVAAALAAALFTSGGTKKDGGAPRAGHLVPSFSAPRLGGSGTVAVPSDGGGGGDPVVLLFFGAWCPSCRTELPALAAAVRQQRRVSGALSHLRVIGVDSEDSVSAGEKFVQSSGVTFPVARDPDLSITSGDFYFDGDPYAVFVEGNGTISAVVPGALTEARFTAEEEKLIPSGS